MDAIDELLISLFKTDHTTLDHQQLDAALYKFGLQTSEIIKVVNLLIQRVQNPEYCIEAFMIPGTTRHKFRKRKQ